MGTGRAVKRFREGTPLTCWPNAKSAGRNESLTPPMRLLTGSNHVRFWYPLCRFLCDQQRAELQDYDGRRGHLPDLDPRQQEADSASILNRRPDLLWRHRDVDVRNTVARKGVDHRIHKRSRPAD